MVKVARILRSWYGVEDQRSKLRETLGRRRKTFLNRLSGCLKGLVYTICITLAINMFYQLSSNISHPVAPKTTKN